MLSGIGPGEHLREAGITPKHDLPGVGQNLQDHLEIYIQMECLKPVSLYRYYNLLGKAFVGAQWLFSRTGIGASNQFEVGGFIRSRAGVRHPDLQYHFFPMAVQSKGWVKLRAEDPHAAPRILFNYMAHSEDWEEFRSAVRLTREIFAQDAFAPLRGRELAPGPGVVSDAEIDAYLTDAVESAYHPSGTCKMGSDELSVVDAECQVHGLDGLRVVDSSIIPSIVSGNLNAPTIMLAEKAADIIAGNNPLEPADVDVYRAADYRDSQR
jgi:choline dehydrogenase